MCVCVGGGGGVLIIVVRTTILNFLRNQLVVSKRIKAIFLCDGDLRFLFFSSFFLKITCKRSWLASVSSSPLRCVVWSLAPTVLAGVGIPGWLPVYRVSDRYTQLVSDIIVWEVNSADGRYTELL